MNPEVIGTDYIIGRSEGIVTKDLIQYDGFEGSLYVVKMYLTSQKSEKDLFHKQFNSYQEAVECFDSQL